ncbi:hypothetical protein CCMSSC00406_0003709 [Pleurotus cornucopiae]|uniref:Uncharacterized protein n=1 Tax=Pleurotus cornucopiae TaxID=5321 RepID=A0ACB7IR72_PLECO|nr:hypothetical protein CCMSSC00406_0003709 [Pleurotus cornucopiae]
MGTDDGIRKKTLKDIIRHFVPAWFAVNMGTGAISILFYSFPYGNGSEEMKILSLLFFFLNLGLFIIFAAVTAARYVLFPDLWSIMLQHPVQSLYLGCAPMGVATMISVAASLIHEGYGFGGKPFIYFVWAVWWLDVAVSALCCWQLMHIMMVRQDHALKRMTAVWLLPVVTFIVASSSGGVIAPSLAKYSPLHAIITLTTSIFLVTIGLSLAFMLLTVYLLRLIVYGIPPGPTVISAFLPLGPMGQAGFSILLAGQAFEAILPYGDDGFLSSPTAGNVINVICTCVSFALWCLTTMWVIYALLAVQEVLRKGRFPFKLPFWGLIFPNGVYANLTLALARTFDASFFRVYGAAYAVGTLVLWSLVAFRTLTLVRGGQIFESPCVEDLDMSRAPSTCANGGVPTAQRTSANANGETEQRT